MAIMNCIKKNILNVVHSINPPLHMLPHSHVGTIWKRPLHGNWAMLVTWEGSRKPHGTPHRPWVWRWRSVEHLCLRPRSPLTPVLWGSWGHGHGGLLRALLQTIGTLLLLLFQDKLSDSLTLHNTKAEKTL